MIIKNIRVVDPGNKRDIIADIEIEDGKIRKVTECDGNGGINDGINGEENGGGNGGGNSREAAADSCGTVIDGTGLTAAPGLVDVHVHFRDPGQEYKEDIYTGAAAAAKGGYTTVVCMANTRPPVDSVEILESILEKGRKTGIHVLQAAAVTKGLGGKELTDMEEAARLDMPLSFHEEDPAFIKNNGINHGVVSEQLGIFGSPALAEDSLVARDCMIALHTGAAVDIQHISSANAVRMVGLAKQLGANVWAEVTPHHFTLTEEAVLRYGTLAKMNPPLRTEADRAAVIEGLKDGTIDMIATDHAPHSREEKEKPLTEAPSGIIGLETALGLGITKLVRAGHLTLLQLMEKMSLNPAKLYHLDCGYVEAGREADLVLFDPDEEWTVGEFASKSSNSPFTGERLFGKVKYTICGGKIVYQDQ